ncbi:hypothetical protein LLG34_08600 [bacterium]|nr:hypothetical protein [bacterium]
MILSLGTDCTVNHGLQDYIGYNPFYDNGIRKSPFSAIWIFNPANSEKIKMVNYYSLGVVSDIIMNKFKGWNELKKNYRGKACSVNYPIEFTHYYNENYRENLNIESIPLFLDYIFSDKEKIFTSAWRIYYGFKKENIMQDRKDFLNGLLKFMKTMKSTKYELKFFFVVDKKANVQIEYIKNLTNGINIKYGILYNEKDNKPGRRWNAKFDCSGWENAINKVGLQKEI